MGTPVNILEKEVFSSTKKALGVLMERYRFKRIAGIFDTMFGNGPKEVYAALRRVAEESGIPFDETLFFSDNDEKKSYSVMKYLLGKRSLGNDDLLYLTSHTFTDTVQILDLIQIGYTSGAFVQAFIVDDIPHSLEGLTIVNDSIVFTAELISILIDILQKII